MTVKTSLEIKGDIKIIVDLFKIPHRDVDSFILESEPSLLASLCPLTYAHPVRNKVKTLETGSCLVLVSLNSRFETEQ